MIRRTLGCVLGVVGLLVMLGVGLGAQEPKTLTVPDDYPTIQAAIDAAEPEDTVFVRAGRYQEAITITKPLQLLGEDSLSTVVSGPRAGCEKWEGSVVEVDLVEGEVLLMDLTLANGWVALRVTLGEGAAVVVDRARLGASVFGVLARGEGALCVQSSLVFTCAFGICTGLAETRLVEVTMGSGEPFALGRDFMIAVGLTGAGRVTIERCLIGPLRPWTWRDSSYAFDSGQFGSDGSFFHFGDDAWFFGGEAAGFRGTVVGSGNRVFVVEEEGGRRSAERKVVSPDLWPRIQSDQFIDEEWEHTVREAHAGCLRGVSALKAAEDLGSWAGDVHEVRDRYTAAEHEFRVALGLLVSEARFPFFEAVLRWLLSAALYGQRRFEEAFAQLEAARPVIVMHLDLIKRMLFDLDIAINCTATGRWAEAAVVLERVFADLPVFPLECRSIWRYDLDWQVAARLGQTYEVLDCSLEAIAAFKASVAYAEWVRSERWTEEEDRRWWMARTRYPYERLVDLLSRQGMGQSAFAYAERSRARTFLDLLALGPVGTLENVADEGIRSGVVEAAVLEADLWDVIRDLPEDTAVLEYFTTEKAVYLWVITRGQVRNPIQIEVDREVLLAQVLAFRQAVETQPRTGQEATALLDILRQARDLYDLLLSPAQAEIEGYAHLVVIPSGPLHYLPFAALYDCPGCEERALWGGTYLVEHYTLSYLPSLTTLKYAQEKGQQAAPDPTLFALGDPDSGNPDYRRLPGAQQEVQTIAGLFTPPPEPTVVLDTEASQTALREGGTGARHVVLSTHGVFNPLNPMYSYLLMAPSDEDDEKLYTHEVFGLGLRADLVTLSACETLLPSLRDAERQVRAVRGGDQDDPVSLPPELLERITAGDELVGLARAFIYAGTPTVLSTLWSVYDESTRHLMEAFYRRLLDGQTDKAQALRQAQLLLLRDPVYGHPAHWAAFTLYGEWR